MDILEAREVVPRTAATVLILNDAPEGLQVLMVRRSPNASFMPNAYVFPGGAVDVADGNTASDETDDALRSRLGRAFALDTRARSFAVAALRESLEECGLWLGVDHPDQNLNALRHQLLSGDRTIGALAGQTGFPLVTSALRPWARWVTPFMLPKRFDTVFFVCRAPAGQVPEVDAMETTTLVWVDPRQALEQQAAGSFQMEFATLAIVRSLLPFSGGNVQSCLDHADALTNLAAVHPRLKLDPAGKVRGVLLPGAEGYDELPGDEKPV